MKEREFTCRDYATSFNCIDDDALAVLIISHSALPQNIQHETITRIPQLW
jgi:hypothetical protein